MEVFDVPYGKIRIIELGREERKAFHQFVEENFPRLGKASLICEKFNMRYEYFSECYRCEFKRVLLTDYHYGSENNNIDQRMSGKCSKCNKFVFQDCIDDNIIFVAKNNIVAFGDYFKAYKKREGKREGEKEGEGEKEYILEILKTKKVYEIDCPKVAIDRMNTGKYISSSLKMIS
jgi:hypothetical protein